MNSFPINKYFVLQLSAGTYGCILLHQHRSGTDLNFTYLTSTSEARTLSPLVWRKCYQQAWKQAMQMGLVDENHKVAKTFWAMKKLLD
jgi:hypothetical protein